MAKAPEQTIEAETRHSVFVNRYAGGLSNDFVPFLERLGRDIDSRLAKEGATIASAARLRALNKDVRELQAEIYASYQESLFDDLEGFSEHEGEFEHTLLGKTAPTYDFDLPSTTQLWSASKAVPLVLPATETAKFLNPFIKDWSKTEIKKVNDLIQFGFAQGQTIDEMTRAVNQRLGKQTKANNKAVVRTAVNHTSTTARERTMRENDDIVVGYKIVATLDSRTSDVCKGYDGLEVKWSDSNHPRPPFHPNCRTTTAPLLDERFSAKDEDGVRASTGAQGGQPTKADQTYYEWLKNQGSTKGGREFVFETLGNDRGKLLLDGGLTSDKFKKLTTDDLFAPITLKELKKKDSLSTAFDKAGI